jgi:hypothetical protein
MPQKIKVALVLLPIGAPNEASRSEPNREDGASDERTKAQPDAAFS